MKRRLLVFLSVICFCLGFQAQTKIYHPFPDSNAVWIEETDNWNQTGPGEEIFSRTFYMKGDTSINSKSYSKMYEYQWYYCVGCPPPDTIFYGTKYIGAVRQDIPSKKVYRIYSDSVTEQLFYNFGLSKGDSIVNSSSINGNIPFIVSSVDSILIGKYYRKRFVLGFNGYIIEGIGSTVGFWAYHGRNQFGGELDCFSQNGKTLFPDTTAKCRLDITESIQPISTQTAIINVFPNPATTAITIKTSQNGNCTVLLTDMLGQTVIHSIMSGQDFSFDVSTLPKGLYIVSVQGMSGQIVGRQKLLVQ